MKTLKPIEFEDAEIQIIAKDGEHWVTATDLAKALGYSRSDIVGTIYRRNADEFTSTMTETIKLTVSGNLQKTVRIFSLRGAHLIAMFARTKKAKAFRRWVLDLIDAVMKGGEYAKRQWEQWHQVLEDKREQASVDGRGLARWRWEKTGVESAERYWRERMQLCLPLDP